MEQATSAADPTQDISPGAQKLLDEGHRILRTSGASACTVGAITRAAGLDKSAVRYYFGNKERLLVALADSILTTDEKDEQRRIRKLAYADDPLGSRVEQQRAKITGPDAITLLELVPMALRHEELRSRLADWQRRHCEMEQSVLALCSDAEEPVRTLTSLTQAVVTGLMVQSVPDPALDIGPVLGLWLTMLRAALGLPAGEAPASETEATQRASDPNATSFDAPLPRQLEQPGVPDPLRDVPGSGRRLVRAAQQILQDEGWAGLSVSAVTSAADLDKAAVSYYFGGKAGLVSAMVESIIHDENIDEIDHLAHLGEAEDVLELHLEQHRRAASAPTVLTYFELVPHLSRNKRLAERLAGWNAWYREVDAYALALYSGRPIDTVTDLATLAQAVTDGLSLQVAANEDTDLDAAYSAWAGMLRQELCRT
jgi:AcrR family transcriptional regulator